MPFCFVVLLEFAARNGSNAMGTTAVVAFGSAVQTKFGFRLLQTHVLRFKVILQHSKD